MVVFQISNNATHSELFSCVGIVVVCNDAVADDNVAYFYISLGKHLTNQYGDIAAFSILVRARFLFNQGFVYDEVGNSAESSLVGCCALNRCKQSPGIPWTAVVCPGDMHFFDGMSIAIKFTFENSPIVICCTYRHPKRLIQADVTGEFEVFVFLQLLILYIPSQFRQFQVTADDEWVFLRSRTACIVVSIEVDGIILRIDVEVLGLNHLLGLAVFKGHRTGAFLGAEWQTDGCSIAALNRSNLFVIYFPCIVISCCCVFNIKRVGYLRFIAIIFFDNVNFHLLIKREFSIAEIPSILVFNEILVDKLIGFIYKFILKRGISLLGSQILSTSYVLGIIPCRSIFLCITFVLATGSDATFVDVWTCIIDIKHIAKEIDVGRLYDIIASIHVIAEATETLGYVELIVIHACILQHIYLCISCYVEDSESFVLSVGLYIS